MTGAGAATLYRYGPYGEPDSWSGSRFRYTGQIALPEAGLYHYKARVYDPELGRFLQTDPIGYADQMNLYAYVGNDPLGWRDPTGLCGQRAGSNFDAPINPCRVTSERLAGGFGAGRNGGVPIRSAQTNIYETYDPLSETAETVADYSVAGGSVGRLGAKIIGRGIVYTVDMVSRNHQLTAAQVRGTSPEHAARVGRGGEIYGTEAELATAPRGVQMDPSAQLDPVPVAAARVAAEAVVILKTIQESLRGPICASEDTEQRRC